jgi:hypothetical protein
MGFLLAKASALTRSGSPMQGSLGNRRTFVACAMHGPCGCSGGTSIAPRFRHISRRISMTTTDWMDRFVSRLQQRRKWIDPGVAARLAQKHCAESHDLPPEAAADEIKLDLNPDRFSVKNFGNGTTWKSSDGGF